MLNHRKLTILGCFIQLNLIHAYGIYTNTYTYIDAHAGNTPPVHVSTHRGAQPHTYMLLPEFHSLTSILTRITRYHHAPTYRQAHRM